MLSFNNHLFQIIQSEEWTKSIFATLGKKSSVFRAWQTAQRGLIEGDFFLLSS